MCAPADDEYAALLGRAGVPLIPMGPTVRSVVAGAKPPSPKAAFTLAPELVAARFETLTAAAAEGCDVVVATGLMPAGVRDVAEKLGIRYALACFHTVGMPSRHFPPASPAGHAVAAGRDRQPGAVGAGRPAGERPVRRGAQPPSGGDRPAAGGQRARPRPRRPAVAGRGPEPVAGRRPDEPRRRPDRGVDPARRPPAPTRAGGVPGRGRTTGVRGLRQHGLARPGGHRPYGRRGVPRARPPRAHRPRPGRSGADRRRRRLFRRRRGQPAGAVPPRGRRRAPRRRGHHDDGLPRRRGPGGGPPDRGPAALGRPDRRTGHRRGARRPGPDRRLPVRRAHDGADPRVRARAADVAGTIRTDGATVAARLLLG